MEFHLYEGLGKSRHNITTFQGKGFNIFNLIKTY